MLRAVQTPDPRDEWAAEPNGARGSSSGETAPGDDVDELRRLLEAQRDIARRTAREADQNRQHLMAAREELARVRRSHRDLRSRRVVRLGLAASRLLDHVVARIGGVRRRIGASRRGVAPAPAPRGSVDGAVVAALIAEGSRPSRVDGPLVSIVMLNRDGAAHLGRTLPALARTAYRPIELVVVDNGSTDESVDIVDAYQPGFPVRMLRNADNRSFSDANNQGAEAASGDLILFLNNDVEPVGPHWLGPLVEALEEGGVVAAGARLVYPTGVPGPRAGRAYADLTIQHAGVRFRMDGGMPLATPIGVGGDPLAAELGGAHEVPALTAACLLVRASVFRACGGFTSGYDYGQEDVDLCLKLREGGGRLVYEGRSVLWHHESATRSREEHALRRARVRANRERLTGIWGPRLHRTVLRSALAGDGFWRSPLALHLVPSVAGGRPLPIPSDLGWQITSGSLADVAAAPGLPDVVVVADPGVVTGDLPVGALRVAWIAGDEAAWRHAPALQHYDLLLVEDGRAGDALEGLHGLRPVVAHDGATTQAALRAWVDARRVTIRVGIPDWDVAEAWGDLHFARDLARALRRLGRPTRIDLLPDWSLPTAARDDLSIHLFGLAEAPTPPGQVNVLWQISHPDLATPELYDRYDVAFVASSTFAAWMRDRVEVPVAPLHQAADPDRFRPQSGGPSHELLFVANSRGVRRHLLDDLLPTPHRLTVYGRSWTPERLDPAYLGGEHVPNDELAAWYAAAAIVLNDHWPDMQREGFLSNRLYDAAAAGAFVISDVIEGLREEFDDGIVSYQGRAELAALVDAYIADPGARAARAARARQAVLARHTFDHRARTILAAVAPFEAARPPAVGP